MGLSTLSLIVLLASSAVVNAKSLKPNEICACVPLNICPETNRFNKEDAKYFATILKCKDEGYVRCCPNNKSVNLALRRSDDDDNVIIIDDDVAKKDLSRTDDFDTTTNAIDLTTMETETRSTETDTTTEISDETMTTEIPSNKNVVETAEDKRKSKYIDNNISVVYPNTKKSTTKSEIEEQLFLIFPNGEIEAALATSTVQSLNNENSSIKPIKRVVVRKRLIEKTPESLKGAESKISEAVIEPKQIDIEEVKKRLSDMYRHNRRKNDLSSRTTTTTTESPVEDTTVLKQRRKRIKYRKQTTADSSMRSSTTSLKLRNMEKVESSTIKSRRKIIYDARGRTNFLKRPSSQKSSHIDEEPIETKTTTTTEAPLEVTMNNPTDFLPLETVVMTTMPTNVVKISNQMDFEHKAMVETVYKTLSAIHSGVDIQLVEKMIESHKMKLKEIRKNPPTTIANVTASRPYRGSARFRKPAIDQPIHEEPQILVNGTRTRNLSRTRGTITTHKSTTKSSRTTVTHKQVHPIISSNALLEEVDMPLKQKSPKDFKASPFYSITMDKFNEFDGDMIDKIHETLRSPTDKQSGFFPVIKNGTPSTLH